MAKIYEDDNCKVLTGEVRLSYLHIFEPWAPKDSNNDPQYSASLIIRKDDKATIKFVKEAIQNAIDKGQKETWGGKIPKNLHEPLRDGDDERDDDASANAFFLNANSKKRKPGVVNSQRETLYSEDEIKSGDYGKVSIRFYPYSANGNNGIACALCNIMKTRDGEALGGTSSNPDKDFDGEWDDDDDI